MMAGPIGSRHAARPTAPLCADSALASFLERSGPGLQQLAFKVTSIDRAIPAMQAARAQGMRLLYDEPCLGTAGSLINFIHPKDAAACWSNSSSRPSRLIPGLGRKRARATGGSACDVSHSPYPQPRFWTDSDTQDQAEWRRFGARQGSGPPALSKTYRMVEWWRTSGLGGPHQPTSGQGRGTLLSTGGGARHPGPRQACGPSRGDQPIPGA